MNADNINVVTSISQAICEPWALVHESGSSTYSSHFTGISGAVSETKPVLGNHGIQSNLQMAPKRKPAPGSTSDTPALSFIIPFIL